MGSSGSIANQKIIAPRKIRVLSRRIIVPAEPRPAWDATFSIGLFAGVRKRPCDGTFPTMACLQTAAVNAPKIFIGGYSGTNPASGNSGAPFWRRWFLYGPSLPLLRRRPRHDI